MAFTWSRNQSTPVFDPSGATAPDAAGADIRSVVGGLLVDLYVYLTDNWRAHPQLAAAIPVMSDAVAAYKSGLGGDPYGPVRKVVDLIKQQQQADPSLPTP